MTDLDKAFKLAINHARSGHGLFGGSPVTISSGSSLGKNILMTPLLSIGQLSGSDGQRLEVSDECFFSTGSDGVRSNILLTYFLPTSFTSISGLCMAMNLRSDDTMTALTTANNKTQVLTMTFTPSSYCLTESASLRSGDSDISFADSPFTLSRAREIRRRVACASSRSYSSGYQMEALQSNSSNKENDESMGRSWTLTGSYMYMPVSESTSLSGGRSGSYTED